MNKGIDSDTTYLVDLNIDLVIIYDVEGVSYI